MQQDLGPMYAVEKAVERRLALLLGERPHSQCWKASTTDMRWRSGDGLNAVLIHISEDAGATIRVGVTITSPSGDESAVITAGEVETAPVLERVAALFPSEIGRILWNEETDRFGNSVSIAILPDARRLRMVRHEPKKPWHSIVRTTVFKGRGTSVRIEKRNGRNDCCYDDLKVAGYSMCWGDGELGPLEQNPDGPDLRERIERYASTQNDENAILCVLTAIVDVDAVWHVKEMEPRLAA